MIRKKKRISRRIQPNSLRRIESLESRTLMAADFAGGSESLVTSQSYETTAPSAVEFAPDADLLVITNNAEAIDAYNVSGSGGGAEVDSQIKLDASSPLLMDIAETIDAYNVSGSGRGAKGDSHVELDASSPLLMDIVKAINAYNVSGSGGGAILVDGFLVDGYQVSGSGYQIAGYTPAADLESLEEKTPPLVVLDLRGGTAKSDDELSYIVIVGGGLLDIERPEDDLEPVDVLDASSMIETVPEAPGGATPEQLPGPLEGEKIPSDPREVAIRD